MQKILIADNSRSVLKTLAQLIEQRLNMQVVGSLSLRDALNAVDEEGPFLAGIFGTVLVDAAGEEIVQQAVRHVPTVVFTSRLDAATQEAMWSRGIVDYVAKESMESFDHVVELLDRLQHNAEVGVLVAHRDSLVRHRLRDLLQRHNYDVREARNQEQVLESVRNQPDLRLLILQATLEQDATTQLLNRVRKLRPREELAVMVLSEPSDRYNLARLIKFGAGGSLAQHCTPEELYSRVALNLGLLATMRRLRDMAIRDELTGAFNRRHFMERGQQEFARWKRHNEPASLIMLDADHFKKVNDTHGHEAGDQVLRQLADTARAQLRTEDVFARLGGEEFVVLAPDTSIQGAMELAERIRAEVEARHVPVKGGRLAFTISLGVAQTLEQDTDLEATLRRADLALYEAKENGRNQVRVG